MRTSFIQSLLAVGLFLTACHSEDPAFVARTRSTYQVEVSDVVLDATTVEANNFTIDDIIENKGAEGAQNNGTVVLDGLMSNDVGSTKMPAPSADATAAGTPLPSGTPSKDDSTTGGDSASEGETSTAAKIAKACAPLFKDIAQQIRVVDVTDPDAAIAIAPDTVIAMHLRGDQDSVDLQLGASSGMAGLCLILTGNQTSLIVSSASKVGKLVYVGRGNESSGAITMVDGSVMAQAAIDLSGNQPQLQLNGVDPALCVGAKLSGTQPTLQCNP